MASSRSLGTLSLDLVARTGNFVAGMDKAERQSAKWRKQVEQNAKAAGAALGAGAAVAIAGLAAVTVSTVNAATEISKLSALANSSSTEFQKFAVGAQVVGIENDKLADILKDVTEKAGEFAATGGGGMADFFENVAPLVGVTADQFATLSGPQALGLYVDTLEKAGLNQQQMTFYMESLASDATALLPLMKNSGQAMRGFADEAERAGAILSEDTIKRADELRAAMFLVDQTTTGMKNRIGSALIPVLADFADGLSGVTIDGAMAATVSDDLASSLRKIAQAAIGAVAAVHIAGKSMKGLYDLNEASKGDGSWWETFLPPVRIYRAIDSMDDIKQSAIDTTSDLDQIAQGWGQFLNKIGGEDSGSGASRLDSITKMFENLKETLGNGGLPAAIGSTTGAIDDQADSLKAQEQALQAYAQLMKDVAGVTEASWSDQSRAALAYQQQVETLREGMFAGIISEEQYERTVEALEARNDLFAEKNEELLEETAGFWEQYMASAEENLGNFDVLAGNMLENFSGRFGNAFESMVFDAESLGEAVGGMAEGMARSVVSALGEMAAQWLAYQAIQLVMGKTSETAAVASAAAAGTSIAAAYAPAAAMASLASFGGNSAPAMAGIASTVGLSETLALAGMAHDGIDSIPQTGTWLLEKGERVTTAGTSAKLDKTLDDIKGKGGGGPITVINNVTVEGQPGMTDKEAQSQGRHVAAAVDALIVRRFEKEMRPGGMLWGAYGGGR